MCKGQSTIEFIGSMLIFLIVLVTSLTVMSDRMPEFSSDVEESSTNMEMYRITNQIMTDSGRHSFGSGGYDWEKNSSTVANTEEFGLANDFHILNKSKIDKISTTGDSVFNYSQFRDLKKLNNQYRFNFVWFPIVETSGSFTRTKRPSNPPIREPSDPEYQNAENRVHYGSMEMLGTRYKFLVAAYNDIYNRTYISDNWNFSTSDSYGEGDNVTMGKDFKIENFQNRDKQPGSSIIFRKHINSFGLNPRGASGPVTKMNRYAVLEANQTDREIVRMEVLAW
ncbi:MAG: hypothetical protein V5A72_01535 [Candidatus Nanohaloarchaea archaeon]